MSKLSTELFFAPSFFSPWYFPSLTSASTDQTPAVAYSGDHVALTNLLLLLRATKSFGTVILGQQRPPGQIQARDYPLIVISPSEWLEQDDADPVLILRTVKLSISIVVRDDSYPSAYKSLDRLGLLTQKAFEASSLGGITVPPLNKISRGSYDTQRVYPEFALALTGQFSYWTDATHRLTTSE